LGLAGTRRATPATASGGQAARRSHGLAGELPKILGAATPEPRRFAGRNESPAKQAQTQTRQQELNGPGQERTEKRRTPMSSLGGLKVAANGEREIVMTRVLDAPKAMVFDAFTKPELVKRWLLGPDGWEMPVCEIDLRVGGKYRYVWRNTKNGSEMGMGGVYREIVVPERIVSTEKFEQEWYPGEAVGTLLLTEHGGKTTITQTMQYDSRATRDAVLQ